WHIAVVMSWLTVVVVAAALAGSGLAGCDHDPAGGAQDGPAVFGMLCASCHGPDGRPPAAMVARLGVRDLTAPEFRARATPALVGQPDERGDRARVTGVAERDGDVAQQRVARYAAQRGAPHELTQLIGALAGERHEIR